ncbi:phosphotransferase [Microbacterium sp. PMB16]|uniref:phosphotransferase n=1 Tax=Microbacterium sp. PMB16 TaxID=3120157 RepID=UPI003F4B70ED
MTPAMTPAPDETESEVRRMLRRALTRAVAELGARVVDDAVFGWRDRSIGCVVERGDSRLWLRVVWSRAEWARGHWWTGNRDAGEIRSVAKPTVIEVSERGDGPVVTRAELMTLATGTPVSATPELRAAPSVDGAWWTDLRHNLHLVARTPTTRTAVDPDGVCRRIFVFFGHELRTDPRRWRASHGDLHWNNLHTAPFGIVDWEAWGLAPRGYDAAFLLCHSLAIPEVAEEIARRFRHDLETEDGVVAQLYVLTKLLTRADGGEHPELVAPIHRHADRLLGRTRPTRPLTQGVNS